MESNTRPDAVCPDGCGLVLPPGADHCCVDALRAVTDALEERSAALEHEGRLARLRWNRREQRLVAAASALRDAAQLAALRYQRRLHQVLLRVGGVKEDVKTAAQTHQQEEGEDPAAQHFSKRKSPVMWGNGAVWQTRGDTVANEFGCDFWSVNFHKKEKKSIHGLEQSC